MTAAPHDVVHTHAVVVVGAGFACLREDQARREGVAQHGMRGEAKFAGGSGDGAEEDNRFAEAAAAPVEDHDFARHVWLKCVLKDLEGIIRL